VNEDLGATAVFGSQIAGLFPGAKYDGVLGMWYGKSPGVDRSGDAFKHANFAGVSRTGGVLAVAGDDATAKSSTLPSQSEAAFYDALMPILSPGNVQEVLDLGRYGFELSRICGLWVGFKIATEVADAFATAEASPSRVTVVDPGFEVEGKPFRATQSLLLVGPWSLNIEREIVRGRLEAAKAFSRANRLNRVRISSSRDRIGIAAPGKTYFDLREALSLLGLDDGALRRFGIRLFQIRMPFPLEPETAREFARGLEEILVLEEKRAFVELFLKDALYHERERPRIVGKPVVPAEGALDADSIASILAKWLSPYVPASKLESRLGVVGFLRETVEEPLPVSRLFHFCSGCPHSRSTTVPEGSIASAGIGCHGMALTMDRSTIGITHMGGEGAQWVGMAPFTETPHIFQNLGDGTLFHSGTLAIRQAVASGATITFRNLSSVVVAMTGGQRVDGSPGNRDLTRARGGGRQKVLVVATTALARHPARTTRRSSDFSAKFRERRPSSTSRSARRSFEGSAGAGSCPGPSGASS
jgi:indolepyruvate ferredoxin oxidoreductase